MEIDEAITLTQDRLTEEGGSMAELLGHFRDRISPALIGDAGWQRVLECAAKHPVILAALPFGFELPLHSQSPDADFGVSMVSNPRTATFFQERARTDCSDETAASILRVFEQMDAEPSPLRDIVGRKLMLEYDTGTAQDGQGLFPGMFLRPGETPILGGQGQQQAVTEVVDALLSSVGWTMRDGEREGVERAYLAQPEDTRMDSFGIFPARERSIRLAVMGFKSAQDISAYLERARWPGQRTAVEDVIARFRERVHVVRTGLNIDVREDGLGPTLGLTLIVKQRYTKDSRYWLDGLTDWDPFLEALGHEELVVADKLAALANWVSKPTPLFARSGRYVLLRGIHHIKLVISEEGLSKAKAYVFMVLSGALTF